MSAPRITAIVVVHGASREQLRACVTSLAKSDGVDLDLVLVDNASPDRGATTRAIATELGDRLRVTVLEPGTNRGFAAGVNAGLRVVRGPLVWLLNDDARVAPYTLARCAETLLDAPDDVVAVAPVVHLDGLTASSGGPVIDSAGLVLRPNGEAFSAGLGQPDIGQYRSGEPCLGPCFVAGLFRAEAFGDGQVGPLDERYFLYYEDVDWAARAMLAGYRVLRVTDSGVVHGHARSARALGEARRYRLVQRNLLLFATLNLSTASWLSVWWNRKLTHAKGLVTGPYRLARLLAVGEAWLRFPALLFERRSRRRGFLRPDDVLFAFAEGEAPFLEAGTFRVTDPAAAERAARARLDRSRLRPDP